MCCWICKAGVRFQYQTTPGGRGPGSGVLGSAIDPICCAWRPPTSALWFKFKIAQLSVPGQESPCPACQIDGERASESGRSRPNALNMSAAPSTPNVLWLRAIRGFCANRRHLDVEDRVTELRFIHLCLSRINPTRKTPPRRGRYAHTLPDLDAIASCVITATVSASVRRTPLASRIRRGRYRFLQR